MTNKLKHISGVDNKYAGRRVALLRISRCLAKNNVFGSLKDFLGNLPERSEVLSVEESVIADIYSVTVESPDFSVLIKDQLLPVHKVHFELDSGKNLISSKWVMYEDWVSYERRFNIPPTYGVMDAGE